MPQFEPHLVWFFCGFLVDQKSQIGYNSTYTSKTGAVNGLLDQDGTG